MDKTKNWGNVISGCQIIAALRRDLRTNAGGQVREFVRQQLIDEGMSHELASEIIDSVARQLERTGMAEEPSMSRQSPPSP